jgi:DNA repair exonuclease SbcCD ATPase subunit
LARTGKSPSFGNVKPAEVRNSAISVLTRNVRRKAMSECKTCGTERTGHYHIDCEHSCVESLKRQLEEAEKALVEAHYLRFDSFLSEVEEFNYKNRNLIKALQEKHCRYLYELKEKVDG